MGIIEFHQGCSPAWGRSDHTTRSSALSCVLPAALIGIAAGIAAYLLPRRYWHLSIALAIAIAFLAATAPHFPVAY